MNSAILLATLLIAAGIAHFITPSFFQKIVPPYLPYPKELVWISGVIEIALGIGLLFGTTKSLAAWGSILLFIAVFPANVYMLQSGRFRSIPRWALWARLPLQFVLLYWAYTLT